MFVVRSNNALRRAVVVVTMCCAVLSTTTIYAQARRPAAAPAAAKKTAPVAQVQQPAARPQNAPQTAAPQQKEDALELTPEENEKYKEALDLFNKQDLQGALDSLRELTNGNPAARPPRIIVAFWFAQLKNMRAARIMLEMATEEDPNDPEAFLTLAEISLREGELTAAELLTLKGETILAEYNANQQRKQSLLRKASSMKIAYSTARKRWPDVQNAIVAKIKAEGETPELDAASANALFQMGQDVKARDMFVRAEKISEGKSLPADAAMARLYATKGDMTNAKQSLNAALKANPKSTPVLLLSITNALSENDLDSAWKLVQQLYQEDKSVEVLKTYGKVALFRADFPHAEAAFQEAVRQAPLDADASNGLALALCEQGNEDKNKRAVQYAASNVQKQGNNRDYLATLGWVLYRTGQTEEAIKVLQQSTADGQINAASAYYFAVVLNDKGQTAEAIKFLQAALSTQPPFAKRSQAQALLNKLQAAPQK